MELDLSQNAISAFKSQAKHMRETRVADGTPTTHAQALELVAHANGARDWNTLHAQAKRPVRLSPGLRVRGTYLGQAFTGKVLGVQMMVKAERLRVTLHFDAPVDVVQFASFSSLRQRVTGLIGKDGRSMSCTSDGHPHLVLETLAA